MLRATLAALALIGTAISATAQSPAPQALPTNPESVRAWVDGAMRVAMEQNNVAGATVTIVKDGKVLLAKGYGTARISPAPRATDADTLFQVASISKTPVYIAIMQLVEAGTITLDDPANAHLPKALQLPDQGFKKPILIRHLMTHSAGFEDSALGHLFVNNPERLMPLETYLARYRVNRVREPGLQTSYSNYALTLLGAIIAHRSGLDFPSYMEAKVLRPMGMARATYRDPVSPELAKKLGLPAPMDQAVAANITQQLGGGVGNRKEIGPELTGMIAPAGGMRASANDMAAYLTALSDPAVLEARGVLKAATFAEMLRPGVPLPGTRRMGFMHYDFDGGRTGFGHGGAMAFGASDLILVPDQRLGVFVSTNGGGGFAFANDLVRRMLRDFAPLPPSPIVRSAEVRQMAKALEGDWIANRRAWHRTEKAVIVFDSATRIAAEDNGDLILSAIDGTQFRLQPLGNGVWQSADRISQRVFAKDADGTMTSWSGSGTGSAVKAGLFERPLLLLIILGATLAFATVTALRALRRLILRAAASGPDASGPLSLTGAAALWMFGIGGFLTTLGFAVPDGGAQLLFDWPGPMPVFAWSIAIALALTVVTLVRLRRDLRSPGWTNWRKAKHVALLALFAIAGVTCWQVGLVGFSGF